jgi:hypothetical protein
MTSLRMFLEPQIERAHPIFNTLACGPFGGKCTTLRPPDEVYAENGTAEGQ